MDVVDRGRGFFWPRPLRKILPSPTVSPNVPMCLSLPPQYVSPPQNDPYCPPKMTLAAPPNDPYCPLPPQ